MMRKEKCSELEREVKDLRGDVYAHE